MTTGPRWADDQVAALQTMAGEGYTGGRIASAIAERFGVRRTRNAVIGKLHRLGFRLAGPQPERKSKPKRRKRPHHGPRPGVGRASALMQPVPVKQKPRVPAPPRKTVTFRGLKPRRCRYPYGDRWPFRFCACKSVAGTSWCAAHYRLVFRPKP